MARHFVLNTGAKIPSVGLGTWQSDPGVVGDAVFAAVKAGYRHIDCTRAYNNEKEVRLVMGNFIVNPTRSSGTGRFRSSTGVKLVLPREQAT